jgi:hypothetical protein
MLDNLLPILPYIYISRSKIDSNHIILISKELDSNHI